jgi:hypothetical protein
MILHHSDGDLSPQSSRDSEGEHMTTKEEGIVEFVARQISGANIKNQDEVHRLAAQLTSEIHMEAASEIAAEAVAEASAEASAEAAAAGAKG